MNTVSKRWDIPHTYRHFRAIYAATNALTTPRHERYAFLCLAGGDLSRCCRKGQKNLYPIALAQAFSWFLCMVDELFRSPGGRVLATAIGEKYPATHCGYCGALPCVCVETSRPENTPVECSPAQLAWSLRDWQKHLESLYGSNNRAVGIDRVINRFLEETMEVGLVIYNVDGFNESLEEVRGRLAREMADILAWIFAVAVVLNADLEQAIIDLYGEGCPVCHTTPCSCRSYEKRPRAGTLTHRFMSAEEIYDLINP